MIETKNEIKKHNSKVVVRNSIFYDIVNLLLAGAYIMFAIGYALWYISTIARINGADHNNVAVAWMWFFQTIGLPLIIPALLVPIARLITLVLSIIGSARYKKSLSYSKIIKVSAVVRMIELLLNFGIALLLTGAASLALSGLPEILCTNLNIAVPSNIKDFEFIMCALAIIVVTLAYILKGVFGFIVSIQGFRIKED